MIMESAALIFNLQAVKLCAGDAMERETREKHSSLFHSVNTEVRVIKAREYMFR